MPHFVSVCNKSLYMEWSEVLALFLCWRLSHWHCLRFTALWLCLSAGAAEVMFWFAILAPVSLDWPQDIITILWPHPPPHPPKKNKKQPQPTHIYCVPPSPPPHDSWPGCCCSLLIQPATVSFIALICSFLSMCGQGARSEWENVHLSERVFGFLCLFVCFFALHFYFVWHCPNKSTLHFLVCVMVKWFTQAMLWSLMALQLTRAMLWISYICLHWWKV